MLHFFWGGNWQVFTLLPLRWLLVHFWPQPIGRAQRPPKTIPLPLAKRFFSGRNTNLVISLQKDMSGQYIQQDRFQNMGLPMIHSVASQFMLNIAMWKTPTEPRHIAKSLQMIKVRKRNRPEVHILNRTWSVPSWRGGRPYDLMFANTCQQWIKWYGPLPEAVIMNQRQLAFIVINLLMDNHLQGVRTGARPRDFCRYAHPLVNIQNTMENHHFSWENSLFLWPFSTANR